MKSFDPQKRATEILRDTLKVQEKDSQSFADIEGTKGFANSARRRGMPGQRDSASQRRTKQDGYKEREEK